MSLRRFLPWIVGLVVLATVGCLGQTHKTQPIASISTPANTMAPTQGAMSLPPPAIFSSMITGPVVLSSLDGDTINPCNARKLIIGVDKPSDSAKFIQLIKSHQIVPTAIIDDPLGGHRIYKLRGILITGKSTTTYLFPTFTLKFSNLTLNDCDHDKRPHALYTKPPFPSLP
jgi:hypothetical protein